MSAAYKLRKGSSSPAMDNMSRRESKSGSKTKKCSSLYAIALTLIYKVGIHRVDLCTPTLPFPTLHNILSKLQRFLQHFQVQTKNI